MREILIFGNHFYQVRREFQSITRTDVLIKNRGGMLVEVKCHLQLMRMRYIWSLPNKQTTYCIAATKTFQQP